MDSDGQPVTGRKPTAGAASEVAAAAGPMGSKPDDQASDRADDNRLIAQRRQKVAELRASGVNPYGNGFVPSHTTAEVVAQFAARLAEASAMPAAAATRDGQGAASAGAAGGIAALSEDRFRVAGRIVAHRSFGKATFVKLRDRDGELQVYVKRDVVGDQGYASFRKLELGDYLGAGGFAFVTRTGELTLWAEELRPLTKALRPWPEKWHGLRDVEARYRQRYLDLVVNREVAAVFRTRARIIASLRRFLDQRGFLEVETPMMHTVVGGAAARPFRTHHNALDLDLSLRIAPELYLKRLVVGGLERVYEIGRSFRNEGLSRRHNPEFTMLEFYQAYATHQDLMVLTEELLSGLAQEICGGPRIVYQGETVDFTPPFERMSVAEAVLRGVARAGLPPLGRAELDDPRALAGWCEQSGVAAGNDELGAALRRPLAHGERVGALFDFLGEQALPHTRPVFVVEYPAETSPLARRNDADPRIVDRFELFIVGREHVNAFSELNDPEDQRARFQRQVEAKAAGAAETMDYDEDYCRALEHGMPPAAGEGIGVDRLVMLLCDQPSIRDVILFPLMRPEGRA